MVINANPEALPVERLFNGEKATRIAIALMADAAGVIAFSRTGDPDVGEYGEPAQPRCQTSENVTAGGGRKTPNGESAICQEDGRELLSRAHAMV